MFAYALASKPCSEATNMIYLSSNGADLGWIWGIKSKEGGFEEEMEGDRWFSSV